MSAPGFDITSKDAQAMPIEPVEPGAFDYAAFADHWAAAEARYAAFVDAVQRRGLDAQYDCALQIDSWHILQPLRPFGGAGNWG